MRGTIPTGDPVLRGQRRRRECSYLLPSTFGWLQLLVHKWPLLHEKSSAGQGA